ncbi:TIGR00730 family Rossman fold protein [Nemorincola caseinilytica]|uniref:Cytokinin riboside 5'-monophosphate phosphoribohydrolase n=1 Tax=Nemorincola caseinilytica TaxID=2054315 RepID=A0ABP8NET0_9BACT
MKEQLSKLRMRDWTETRAHSSWQIFKIMAEFVQGFEVLSRIGPCISIFGSARTKPGHKYYELTVEIAQKLSQEGFGIITGGGPGIMEAGNKGAHLANGKSVGLNIDLPFEQESNKFIKKETSIDFDYFFVRKVMFTKYAQAFIMMPGGWGTLDEFFEVATLIQTQKFIQTPMVCVGSEYWGGLFDWMRKTMLEQEGNISPGDLEMIKIFDTADEVVSYISEFYTHNKLQPNF